MQMTKQGKNKIRASFLLLIFSLNIVAGFACSLGIDMGFNSKHHHDQEIYEAIVHIHVDGKKHIHQEKSKDIHSEAHHQDKIDNHRKSDKEKDNCCNDEVTQLTQVDKSVPQFLAIVHPIFLNAFFDAFYNLVLPFGIVKDVKKFLRSYHPPISNIRIAIQSFQI